MAALPLELILEILKLSMVGTSLVDLEMLVLGNKTTLCGSPIVNEPFAVQALKEHQNDWAVANSICHAWRQIGRKAFFESKVFLIGPNLMKRLNTGRVKSMSSENQTLLFTHLRRVIIPVPSILPLERNGSEAQWLNLHHFNVLTGVQSAQLLLFANWGRNEKMFVGKKHITQDLPNATDVPFPESFLQVLQGDIGLDTDRIQPRFLVSWSRCRELSCDANELADREYAFLFMLWVGLRRFTDRGCDGGVFVRLTTGRNDKSLFGVFLVRSTPKMAM
ncbi:uncharacterized protein KY384_003458 [Bacidia gigantensis]|uniref:uncharacterized protein n=1 Tax=Bacidia gigantensis TaxID=2732470 RepID=UPI001D03ECBB|nr:uncharacterized protein KY384_003458 [Bacidia gigantensis]KAG8531822.1 hypothetical protein KY384_003458 [Bacidia gigantensis]